MALPPDHSERMARVRASLDGLSVGDAFGERFFLHPDVAVPLIEDRAEPKTPWHWTDDTAMALSICEVLSAHGRIDRDALAVAFGRRYAREPDRGYGGGAHAILRAINLGLPWQDAAGSAFDGGGSMGNGAAMRVAPVGAYFADDLGRVVEEARASAEPTHAHADGQAGAIAAAVAAAAASQMQAGQLPRDGKTLLDVVYTHTPDGATREGIDRARELFARGSSVALAVAALGSGARVISADTVPFALWCAAHHLDDYVEAMWLTVSGLGDRDTTCAIAGGVVALSAGPEAVPVSWLRARAPADWR